MNTEYDYFLLIAEEMNISRAAERAFVSQQSMSKYLRQLEDKYSVTLFYRRPKLSLTPAGEVFLNKVRKIKAITTSLEGELKSIEEQPYGKIIFGCSITRIMQIATNVLPLFYNKYPNVSVEHYVATSYELTEWVVNSRINVCVGVSLERHKSLNIIPLVQEKIYLCISNGIMQKKFGDRYKKYIDKFKKSGADISCFNDYPFLINKQYTRMGNAVSNLFQKEHVNVNARFLTNNIEVQLLLAIQDCGICFVPQSYFEEVNRLNRIYGNKNYLNCFEIQNFDYKNNIELAYRRDMGQTAYFKYFIELIEKLYKEFDISYLIQDKYILDEKKEKASNNVES